MIDLAEEADEEYGRRLREGLEEKSNQSSSMHPLGAEDANKAPKEAIEKGKRADPY